LYAIKRYQELAGTAEMSEEAFIQSLAPINAQESTQEFQTL